VVVFVVHLNLQVRIGITEFSGVCSELPNVAALEAELSHYTVKFLLFMRNQVLTGTETQLVDMQERINSKLRSLHEVREFPRDWIPTE
jgi:hypothetical protein